MVQDFDSDKPNSPIGSDDMNSDNVPSGSGGIKSYSDFIRNLAAKYNNNE